MKGFKLDIKQKIELQKKELYSIIDANSNEMKQHVIPIFIPDNKSKPRILGSGTLLAIENKHFLISAAHVFDENETGTTLYFPQENSISEINGEVYKTRCACREYDKIDLAFMPLDSDVVGKMPENLKFLKLDDLLLDDTPHNGKFYSVTGYPFTTNKRIAYKNKSTLKSTILCHLALAAKPEKYKFLKKLGFTTDTHIFLEYDRKNIMNSNKEKKTAPLPHGISGGGMWLNVDLNAKDYVKKLIAIGIEYKAEYKVLIGTRIELILTMISKLYPNLKISRPPKE
jgi:hypothetical protein